MSTPSMFAGESKYLVVSITDSDGNIENINDCFFNWKLNVRNNPLVKNSSDGDILITDGINGIVTITLTPEDTANFSGIFSHELEMTDSQGNISVVLFDKLQILANLFN